MSAVSLLKRIREWGGRELASVSLYWAIGVVLGILISLLTVTTEEDAEDIITSSQRILSRGIVFSSPDPAVCSDTLAESSKEAPAGRSPSDQTPRSEVPPSSAPLKQWRFIFEEWRVIFVKNLVVALLMATVGAISAIIPAAIAAFNGIFLGRLSMVWVRQSGGGVVAVVAIVLDLAPHGVIEMTGICVAGAAGMRLSRVALEENFLGRLEALRASWPVLLVVTPSWL